LEIMRFLKIRGKSNQTKKNRKEKEIWSTEGTLWEEMYNIWKERKKSLLPEEGFLELGNIKKLLDLQKKN
jgi:hypothetical protein